MRGFFFGLAFACLGGLFALTCEAAECANTTEGGSIEGGSLSAKSLPDKVKNRCISISNATVEDDLDLSLLGIDEFRADHVTFSGQLLWSPQSENPPSLYVFNSKLHGNVDLYHGQFGEIEFQNCTFDEQATFHSITVSNFYLDKSRFDDRATFVAMNVSGDLTLADTTFRQN